MVCARLDEFGLERSVCPRASPSCVAAESSPIPPMLPPLWCGGWRLQPGHASPLVYGEHVNAAHLRVENGADSLIWSAALDASSAAFDDGGGCDLLRL